MEVESASWGELSCVFTRGSKSSTGVRDHEFRMESAGDVSGTEG